jgi:hypothetical protein
LNDGEKRRYCELLLGMLQKAATQQAKIYSAFSDKKQLERRIHVMMKNANPKYKMLVRLLAVMVTLNLIFVGAAAAYAISGNTNQSYNEDALVTGGDLVFYEVVDNVALENKDVSILNGGDILIESGTMVITPMASGDLGAGKSYSYDKQYIAKGKRVTINAEWAPAESDLMIGLKSAKGSVTAKTVSGGSGSVTYEIKTSGDYYIYIGNPSKSAVKFVTRRLVPRRSAPSSINFPASSKLAMPPAALILTLGPTCSANRATSSKVAPALENPVLVLI